MSVSVIIPTLNFAAGLKRMVENIRLQTADIGEILIVDSSSADGTADEARAMGLKVLTVPAGEFDHGGTRSLASRAASGEILVFLTQDAELRDRDAIGKLAAVLGADKVGAAYGRQLPHPGADIFGRALRLFNYPEVSYLRAFEDRSQYGIKTPFLSNSFAAYSRKALGEIGWFKDGLILGEDTYAGAKLLMAGYRLGYAADAVVLHSHNYTPLQDFRRYFDIGVFHEREKWILESFGGAEGEGLKFVLAGLRFLKENGEALKVPEFFLRTALKLSGYRAGRAYRFLPAAVRRACSMHRGWWGKGLSARPRG